MNKLLWILLAIICLAGSIFGIVMTVMAVRFMEYGRMVFYGTIAFISLELLVIAIFKLKKS